MSKRKYTDKHIPEGVLVRYFHIRVGTRIVETVCNLVEELSGDILATGHSHVSPKDNPSKKIGRAISIGRALKIYHGEL